MLIALLTAAALGSFDMPPPVRLRAVNRCTPTTCVAEGKDCGSISNNCGGTLSCGSCDATKSCSSNVCTLLPMTLVNSFEARVPTPPTFAKWNGTTKPKLTLLCKYRTASSNWQCVTDDSDTIWSPATMTQGTSTVYRDGPFGRVMTALSDTTAPKITNGTMPNSPDGGTFWEHDFTAVGLGYHTLGASSLAYVLHEASTSADGYWARIESAALHCSFFETAGFPEPTAASNPIIGWAITSCRRKGTAHIARVNGTDGTTVTATPSFTPSGATRLWFGSGSSANQYILGQEAWVAFFGEGLTTTDLAEVELDGYGAPVGMSGYALGSNVQCFNPDGGNIECYRPGGSAVFSGSDGIPRMRTVRGGVSTNKMAASALDVSSWTDVGTPTITAITGVGPFIYNNAPTCYRITDDDGAAFEGKAGANAYTSTPRQAGATFFLAVGDGGTTVTKARIRGITNGTFSDGGVEADCDVTLAGPGAMYHCNDLNTGGSSIVWSVLQGWAASDTGSLTACWGGENNAGWVSDPNINNTAVGDATLRIDAGAFPTTSAGGAYEELVVPAYDPAGTEYSADTSDNIRLFDLSLGPDHTATGIMGYQTSGTVLFRLKDQGLGVTTDFTLAGAHLTPGLPYDFRVEWRAKGDGTCDSRVLWDQCSTRGCATTVRASAAAGACPSQPQDVHLLNRYDISSPTPSWFQAFYTYTVIP